MASRTSDTRHPGEHRDPLRSDARRPRGPPSSVVGRNAKSGPAHQRARDGIPPLIDLQLKSEEIIDVLERHDMEVVYQFDRDFEGADDEYQSSSASGGFEFVFDATQRLATVFLYIRPRGEFAAIDVASIDVPVYPCIDAARDAFENGGDAIRQGDGWIKAFVAGSGGTTSSTMVNCR